jgi:hypothetical protein
LGRDYDCSTFLAVFTNPRVGASSGLLIALGLVILMEAGSIREGFSPVQVLISGLALGPFTP